MIWSKWLQTFFMHKNSRRIIFGLGSNLGDRKNNLMHAIKALKTELFLVNIKQSRILISKALLKPDAPQEWDLDFFNIALSADINMQKFPPEKILEITQSIERKLGRKANENKILWAPREIDIDILAIENLIIDLGDKLKIPHQSLLQRDFFLKPMAEIEPNWQYPNKNSEPFGIY